MPSIFALSEAGAFFMTTLVLFVFFAFCFLFAVALLRVVTEAARKVRKHAAERDQPRA